MNPLNDIVPAKYRKPVYALIALAALVVGALEAAHGNWAVAAGSLIVTLSHSVAASNTDSVEPVAAGDYDGHGTYADEVPPPAGVNGE